MAQNKFIILMVLGVLNSCTQQNSSSLVKEFNKAKLQFNSECTIDNLFSHFPDQISDNYVGIRVSPPGYNCENSKGYLYLTCSIGGNEEILISDSTLFSTQFSSSDNFVIDPLELKVNSSQEDSINRWQPNKLPIPNFRRYDFGLGKTVSKTVVDGTEYFNHFFSVPNDLEVTVVSSEPGNYWKKGCGENRPDALLEWKYGYSKGIAISKEIGIVVYWVLIW